MPCLVNAVINDFIKAANMGDSINDMRVQNDEEAKTYADYYKELFDVISNLAIFYTYEGWNVERKKYIITNNLDDMKKMTEKLKEVNSLYNELKDGQED